MSEVLVWGATGQAKVVGPMIEAAGHQVILVVDRRPGIPSPFDVRLVGPDEAWDLVRPGWHYVLAIGGTNGRDRLQLGTDLEGRGLIPLTLVHHRAWVADSAHLGPGVQVCALAAISEEATVDAHTIVNTAAVVDHECVVGTGVHVMPGATVAGSVTIADFATIGSNATVLPRVNIGRGATVGAGAVVVHDVAAGATVVGARAREVRAGQPSSTASS